MQNFWEVLHCFEMRARRIECCRRLWQSCMVVLHSVELFAFYVWRNIASYCIAVDLHSVNTHCDIVVVYNWHITAWAGQTMHSSLADLAFCIIQLAIHCTLHCWTDNIPIRPVRLFNCCTTHLQCTPKPDCTSVVHNAFAMYAEAWLYKCRTTHLQCTPRPDWNT